MIAIQERGGIDHYVLRSLQDFRFYFHEAAAKMGIRAIDYEKKLVIHSGTVCTVPTPYQLAAARRHANIERALKRMCSADVALIRTTCEAHARERWRPFGDHGLGNVADRTETARRWHHKLRSTRTIESCLTRLGYRLQMGRATTEDRVIAEKIRGEVEQMICAVHASYETARKGVR